MKKLKLILQCISLLVLLQSAVLAWEPPIGIPRPSFGIEETYRMYDEPANRNPSLIYTQNPEGGYYTHYVDNTDTNATDTDNLFGTAQTPRVTFPPLTTIVPGSVVEMHGGPYAAGTLHLTINGSQTQPIFVRGASINDRPVIERTMYVRGHYIIVENIDFDKNQRNESALNVRAYSVDEEVHHVSVRDCEAHNLYKGDTGSPVTMMYPVSYIDGIFVEDVVFYNNHIHPDFLAPPDDAYENDTSGIYGMRNTNRVWIVDNYIHHVDGDCIGAGHDSNYTTTNYYIGRNILHNTSENALDFKEIDTCIISENVMNNFAGGTAGQLDGVAMVIHYGPNDAPRNLWVLYNEIYNANGAGIQVGGGQTDDVYIIGNIIHDIRNGIVAEYMFENFDQGGKFIFGKLQDYNYIDANGVVDLSFTSLSQAFKNEFQSDYDQFTYIEARLLSALNSEETATVFRTWDCQKVYMMNNVFYNNDNGVSWDPPYGQFFFYNNIISNVSADGYHLSLERSRESAEVSNNLFYQPGGESTIMLYVTPYNLSDFQLNTGKGAGCLDTDPLFVDPTNNDFNVQSGSPAIDAGVEHSVYELFRVNFGIDIRVDYNGNMRPQGSAWDIGAYEWGSTPADPDSETDPEPETDPDADPEAFTPDATALIVMNNIIKSGGNQSASIRCDMKESGKLTLRIYDTKGKEIITVCNEERQAGRHEFVWAGRDSSGNTVGSGIYIVHLKSGGYSETKKIAIIK